MELPFATFRRKQRPVPRLQVPADPVPADRVPTTITKEPRLRAVTILHPDESGAFRLKSRLRESGHRRIETFFLPEPFLAMVEHGHHPDVVFIHDFEPADAGMTGVELARTLRIIHDYKGLIFSTSPDHRRTPGTLQIHGFSGHADDYLAG